MRHIFQKTTYPLLEEKIRELNMDMANNYKDNAQDDFAELEKVFEELTAAKKLNERQQEYYCDKIHEYREILKGYTHKDQKATW